MWHPPQDEMSCVRLLFLGLETWDQAEFSMLPYLTTLRSWVSAHVLALEITTYDEPFSHDGGRGWLIW